MAGAMLVVLIANRPHAANAQMQGVGDAPIAPTNDLLADLGEDAPEEVAPIVDMVPLDLLQQLRPEDSGLKPPRSAPPLIRNEPSRHAPSDVQPKPMATPRYAAQPQDAALVAEPRHATPVTYAKPIAYGEVPPIEPSANQYSVAIPPVNSTANPTVESVYTQPVESTYVESAEAAVYEQSLPTVSPPAVYASDTYQYAGEAYDPPIVDSQVIPVNHVEDARPDASPQPGFEMVESIGKWAEPENFESTLRTFGLLTVVSLAPAILLMTTSFVRISIVLGLLRQAIGAQMLPSNQIVTSLAMFLTVLVMTPVWTQVYNDAIVPYTQDNSSMTASEAWAAGVAPVREFMSQQIHAANNDEDVLMFYEHLPSPGQAPESYEQVPLQVLLPAFMLSELKTAFLMGFQIFLPFLILDLVVSSVTVSMGMMMLPPSMVSLPLKLILFVLVDGWQLVVGMLLQSFSGFV